MDLPLQYIVQKFYQYVGDPKLKKGTNTYYGSCCICREGHSWLKKKRLYFVVDENKFFCQNEQRSWTPIEWIKEASGLAYEQILEEASQFDQSLDEIIDRYKPEKRKKTKRPSLPVDSINLFDTLQVRYHINDKPVIDCLNYIKERRLDTAINRPRTFYTSLKDYIHKNRLCIPYIDEEGKIVFYQTRAIYKEDETPAKYLSKVDGERTLYGINNIDSTLDSLFIFEGPIDAMFVKNGLAAGGIMLSEAQEAQLDKFRLFNKIWVLDNSFVDKAANERIHKLIERGDRVFIPPVELREFKDLNEVCVKYGLDQVSPGFFIKNSFIELEALMKLKN